MKNLPFVFLVLLGARLGRCCVREGTVLICHNIPSYFERGCSSLVMFLQDVGVINSTVFDNDNLTTVTRFSINNAGITGVTEAAFYSFHSLRSLSLERNLLTQIHQSWFRDPAGLTELSLTGNDIEVVNESMLQGLRNLTTLRMNRNRVKSISPSSFSSQSFLTELDLSENRLTQISAQTFSSLSSTSIRLHGNPWDCSCGSEGSIASLKDLHSRLQLEKPTDVICGSPPSLRGQPVLSVSECASPPPPGPTSDAVTSASADLKTMAPSPGATSLHLLRPAAPETDSSQTDLSMTTERTTLPPSHATPPMTCRPQPGAPSAVGVLVAVIGVLSVCLLVCIVVLLCRGKGSNKVVMPEQPTEEMQKKQEANIRSRLGSSEEPEAVEKKTFAGIRAKSADAVILSSPFCVDENEHRTLQRERGKQEGVTEAGGTGVCQDVPQRTEEEPAAQNTNGIAQWASVLYFSIGTRGNKASPPHHHVGQRSQHSKAMWRISTWPATAAQWEARCNREGPGEGTKLERSSTPPGNSSVCPAASDWHPHESQRPPESMWKDQEAAQNLCSAAAEKTSDLCQDNLVRTPAHRDRSIKSEQRKPVVTCRTMTENVAARSTRTSPDDETLLSGGEHEFMNLLHEVVQNHGRWTRERWKQTHSNKQPSDFKETH